MRERRKISTANLHQIGVKESNGDVTSDPTRSLAAEIDVLPVSAKEKPLIAPKPYTIDGKCC
jgi:hypothetical protein